MFEQFTLISAEGDQLIDNEELEYNTDSSSVSEDEDEKWFKYTSGDPQIGRHTALLILLSISLLIVSIK